MLPDPLCSPMSQIPFVPLCPRSPLFPYVPDPLCSPMLPGPFVPLCSLYWLEFPYTPPNHVIYPSPIPHTSFSPSRLLILHPLTPSPPHELHSLTPSLLHTLTPPLPHSSSLTVFPLDLQSRSSRCSHSSDGPGGTEAPQCGGEARRGGSQRHCKSSPSSCTPCWSGGSR